MDDQRLTEELQAELERREAAEQQLARASAEESEIAQHERRADKAHYLRQKLEERLEAERDAAERDAAERNESEPDAAKRP
jgi:hypothetical protein